MTVLLVSVLAGALTTLSPCVLPILPIVLFGALNQHRFGPLALAGGLIAAFIVTGAVIYGAGSAFAVPGDAIRNVAAAMLVLFGLILLSTVLQQRLIVASSGLMSGINSALTRYSPQGLGGQFAVGAMLGVVWAPCSGPTLGTAVTLAADSGTLANALAIMLFFGIGACLPLLAIAYGSRQTLKSRQLWLSKAGRIAKPMLGTVLVVVGLLVLLGIDKALETVITNAMPDWLVGITTRY